MNNNRQLFLASFFTLIAAGMGFAVRGAILADWASDFGFTKQTLGDIAGAGLWGFPITIILCSLVADRVGYKPLMVLAFLLHVGSAVATYAATPVFNSMKGTTPEQLESARLAAFNWLYAGALLFSLANGVCESVINPLVATLYPNQKTHYLNILHAGWPGGLIIGGILAYVFCGRDALSPLPWQVTMAFFLPPTLYYGFVIAKEKFPISEARAAGVSFGTMLAEFASPILLLLLLLHALVGYVELGTDSWITNIMNAVVPGNAILLFIYTSGLMFVLRFFAGPIVERINPVGLLFVSSILGCIGLTWLGSIELGSSIVVAFAAATTYGLGKTFLWPTMLGIAGERFPKGGALTMGAMGACGMLSAGLIGNPAIGYQQDKYASEQLRESAPETYERFRAPKERSFLIFPAVAGLDGAKVGLLDDKIKEKKELTPEETVDRKPVESAGIYGGQMALRKTAYVPAAMAVGYLILVLYFRAKGGYKSEVLHGAKPDGEHYTGGTEGPGEG
ncbi:MAG: MFS transporter [Planctomycetia bacterium]|nr:MFS transporter [Planctomycetia bacterium]